MARVALIGGSILSGTDRLIDDGAVVIEDQHIVAVGARRDLAAELADTPRVIDIQGRTLVPGLIDCHVHLMVLFPWERGEQLTDAGRSLSTAYGIVNARAAVEAGVTTVRDLGCEHGGIFGLRTAIDRRVVLGPRIFAAGQAIAMTGGHGTGSISIEVDGTDAVRKAVRTQVKLGADCIKLMATGGCNTPTEALTSCQLTFDELAAGVEVACQAGRPTATHATSPPGVINAVRAGITSVEHGVILDDSAVTEMVRHSVYFVPTMSVYHVIAERGSELGLPDYWYAKGKEALDYHRESVQRAIRAKVTIAVGTDAGYRGNPVGPGYVDEMLYLVEAGLAPADALAGATRVAAELLGIADRLGTIEPGKLADLIAVDGSPLDDLNVLRQPDLVLKDGSIVIDRLGAISE